MNTLPFGKLMNNKRFSCEHRAIVNVNQDDVTTINRQNPSKQLNELANKHHSTHDEQNYKHQHVLSSHEAHHFFHFSLQLVEEYF